MLVKDVMTKNPVTVTTGVSIPEVKGLMTQKHVTKLPVLDKNGALVGIITDSDLIKASPSDATTLDMFELSYLLSKLTVEKTMVKKVITVIESEPVEEAARLMDDMDVSCLPVLRNGLVVGIITEKDLFRSFVNMFGTRHAGVRATFVMSDRPGDLANFTKILAENKSNIVSLVTSDVEEENCRKVTMRVTDIELPVLEKIIHDSNLKLEDIRNV
ncbi:MAG: CBS and ACT domain-containing protein [Treponema sp.]|nr:CBS and ACT domain-containing protein [Treponema sp.]